MGQLIRPETPPELPKLHASKVKLQDVLEPSYWKQLCPGLHVTHEEFMAKVLAINLPRARLDDLKEQINHAGVAQVSAPELPWSENADVIANAIINLMRYGWPPSFIVMYDEVWSIIKQAELLMDKATGGNACNMDILAWYVDPNRGDVGFSPHRDRQPDDSPATFRPDGTAMYATLWLPLTDATPENSCLYVIPRFCDPGYYEGDPDDDDAPDPLTTALPNKDAYQNIRALPANKGSAVIFTHRTIHWGSKGRPGYPTPRISMSWGCADDGYEPPYFSRRHLPCPPLELRLALAGAQMIVYHERFPAPPKQLALYYKAFTSQADHFDVAYKTKVLREFVDASKEATAVASTAAVAPASKAAINVSVGTRSSKGKQQDVLESSVANEEQIGRRQEAAAGKRATKRVRNSATDSVPREDVTLSLEQRRQKRQPERGSMVKQPTDEQQQQQHGKKQRRHSKQFAAAFDAPPQGAAALAEVSDEDGDSIDWKQIAAAARQAAKKDRKHESVAAAGGSSDSELGFGGDDSESDGDVMDLALDSMLDAAMAGERDLQDDFEDD